jgi:hypothetical protein
MDLQYCGMRIGTLIWTCGVVSIHADREAQTEFDWPL